MFFHELQRRCAVSGCADDVQALLREQLGEAGPKQLMIVDYEDVDRVARVLLTAHV